MITIYIAVCQDRHIDPVATAHTTRETAIEYARQYMMEHVSDPDGLSEDDDGERWSMWYEYESDNAFVVPAELMTSNAELTLSEAQRQEPLGYDFSKVLYENMWNLYES